MSPRVSRTLKRGASFRPLEKDDLKYIWAAYRMGSESLREFDASFGQEFTSDEFREALIAYIEDPDNYHGWWVCEAKTKEGVRPVGFIAAKIWGRLMFIGGMVWFPWASKRNILESALAWIAGHRRQYHIFEFAKEKDKGFFEQLCRYKVMRRVGTSHDLYPNHERAAVFESCEPRSATWREV